jgi:hypothetical protein
VTPDAGLKEASYSARDPGVPASERPAGASRHEGDLVFKERNFASPKFFLFFVGRNSATFAPQRFSKSFANLRL